MKRILLALGLLIGSIGSAFAACTSPVVMHDFPGTSFNMSVLTAPDGNCATASAVQTWAGSTLGAMANYGTSPGAVLVPGVNASVTNTPSVAPSALAAWGLVASTQNGATPTNGQLSMAQFNTTPTTITSGNVSPLQMDNAGNLLVNIKAGASSGAVAQGSTTSGQTGGLTQAAVTTASPAYTTGQTSPLSLDTTGALRVNVTAGGAGGGAVTMAASAVSAGAFVSGAALDGWDATQGAKADAVCGTATGTCSVVSLLKYLNTAAGAAIPAGTNVIGHVIADTGSTTAVTALPATPTGSNVIGKVGIDQTTPGTTNLVALAANQSVNLAQVGGATTAVGSGVQATALRTTLATDSPGIVTLGQTTKSASVPVAIASDQGSIGALSSQYPSGATPITASATGTTAATTATLTGAASVTTYICGFSMRSVATAAAAGNATVTGTITGTLNFTHGTGVTPSVIPNDQRFNPCVPASATNTSIAVVSPAAGTGGVMSVTAWGYRL